MVLFSFYKGKKVLSIDRFFCTYKKYSINGGENSVVNSCYLLDALPSLSLYSSMTKVPETDLKRGDSVNSGPEII